jgi:hypothetical protein
MTGHVPETVGHDAENTGHALPKYAPGVHPKRKVQELHSLIQR